MKSLQVQIGINLKKIRKLRGYSLDQLSGLSSVSKGMLAQIEKGESSPTVNTLWKIANGLQVSFSSLIEEKQSNVSVVRLEDKKPLTEDGELYQVYPFFPFDSSKKFEIYFVELQPGCRHCSERHHDSVEEYILVCDGEVTIRIGEQSYKLKKAESIHFQANDDHTYENETGQVTNFYNVIFYP
ncbi:XRE family transcriptional regulator [Metabacillus fastidiosus]|uniref:helix-turn-helix domain-containing protein n=1 Tax=Metabacillus fastidiosus TaxID=1458 RepID=UPI002DBFE850|nr:XRE family transcriptional regulator [Metabacillus fastidiosus]MEC2077576.1 XRE family transcriptional regulator [Metabacillus fastidiosus]